MKSHWRALDEEVARWRDAGRTVEFWLRDDDAARPHPALDRLLALSGDFGIPVALAVVPLSAEPALFARFGSTVSVLQHGADHVNRAAPGCKKTEFPDSEPGTAALERLGAARARLTALTGGSFVPVLAPAWNRFPDRLMPGLAGLGILGLSRYGPRRPAESATGLQQVNTHVDIVAWKRDREFVGEAEALAAATRHLAARREGRADAREPTGWLTHHACHDGPAWRFLEQLFETTGAMPGVCWRRAEELFHT